MEASLEIRPAAERVRFTAFGFEGGLVRALFRATARLSMCAIARELASRSNDGMSDEQKKRSRMTA